MKPEAADTAGPKRIGVIGCGNIASQLGACAKDVEFVAVFDRHHDRAEKVAGKLGAAATDDFETFLGFSFDLVLETASVEAVACYAARVLETGSALAVLSSGALADAALRQTLEALAAERGTRIHIPSGALFGLDNAAIGRVGGLERVKMVSCKPPASLKVEVEEKTCLFRGSAFECIRHYPKNANAAVSLALASGMTVDLEVWADPACRAIHHDLLLEGEFGSVSIALENRISEANPSTSYLAVLSLCALLEGVEKPLVIGG